MIKLASLFDGSGGFPLAASMCGIDPVWACEVEPYPIAVTTSRFPGMKHLGSVTDVKGNEVEPVDIITFGSPCQDLSVAGKRSGLKHESNGDEETTRSGLFMEAVRIIKEMREATNGVYPRIAVWENVLGAFSSNKSEDFRTVLEELIKIAEPGAPPLPSPGKEGWPYADCIVGVGWSLAYRVFDAKHWGVPQRRRRIYLVADFTGECAEKVLFERPGFRGHFEESGTPWQGIAEDAERGTRADDREGKCITYGFPLGFRPENVRLYKETATTICNGTRPGYCNAVLGVKGLDCYNQQLTGDIAKTLNSAASDADHVPCVVYYAIENHPADSRVRIDNGGEVQTLTSRMGTGGGNVPMVLEDNHQDYFVRRHTPNECARLQGFPDNWGHPDKKTEFSDAEYQFWLDVRNTHATINGNVTKEYTREQMLNWYNKLRTDSAEYKMWGNGIALPNALYVMQGIADCLEER